MKAIVWTKYGGPSVLQLREVEKPTPKDDELLIRVHATTVTTGDCELRRMDISALTVFWLPMRIYVGLLRPTRIRILGQELAGEIEAVGEDVTQFKIGDQVFAAAGFKLGANAEYLCLPEDGTVALKPANLSFEEAAAVPFGGLEAWQYLKRADIEPGHKVLVNGAGGSIGTYAIQLARNLGAAVTAVDSEEKLDMLHSIGADQVIDYTREDFTATGEQYDIVFDAVGTSSYAHSKGVLKPGGKYLSANPGITELLRGLWNLARSREEVLSEYTGQRNEDLVFLRGLIEAGELVPVIDRSYQMEETVDAHRYVETGRKLGSVVILQ